MKIAVATDFIESEGSPERALRLLADAGFTHVHWCHQWCSDFIYGQSEILAIKAMLKKYGLKLLDIHGSDGKEKKWYSLEDYQRKAGVELVTNRIEMLRELEGEGVLMMHVPFFHVDSTVEQRKQSRRQFDALKYSIDELLPLLERENILIAVENMWADNWELLGELFDNYDAKYIGLCYDSGHGNSDAYKQIDVFEKYKGRLEALHLHDNDGRGDLHQAPFEVGGTVQWDRIVRIIAESSYKRMVSFELSMRNTKYANLIDVDESVLAFLQDALVRCVRLDEMVNRAKLI